MILAYLSQWSSTTCEHFVRYEGACIVIALALSELLLFIRVLGLYWGKKVFPAAIFLVWLVQQAVSAWLLTNAHAVPHEGTSDHACTMIFSGNIGSFPPSLTAWIPLLYDTMVIGLVLYKCLPQKKLSMSHVVDTLIKDGLLYYGVLFAVNLVLGVMIIAAPVCLPTLYLHVLLLTLVIPFLVGRDEKHHCPARTTPYSRHDFSHHSFTHARGRTWADQ